MSHRLLTLTGELPPGATQVLGDGPVEALPSPSSLALQRSAAMHALTQEESEAGGGAASQNEGRKRLLGLEPEKGEEAVAMADGAATPATALVGEENGEETPETPTTDDLFFTDPQRKPRRPISAKALRPIPGLKEGISSPPLFYGPAPAPGASPRAMLVTSPRKGSVSAAADGAMMTVPPSPFQAGAKILDGFLFKRGQLTGAFYRRWFVIRGSRLFWFSRYKVGGDACVWEGGIRVARPLPLMTTRSCRLCLPSRPH